ncbi:MAG TPA: chemotaxis-specific protein-glutamate methyltransferase CheB [Noviherbaspirillum sp.]|nr:chemotaxis-specific protein-glutamate methyltransferase CheB [Noviherbaspirillum sp.]
MRIGIVNDVALIAEALRRLIVNTREHEVIWVAHGGLQALRLCAEQRPDLVLMDLIMPDIDGAEATRRIMTEAPCPILIVTASPDENTNLVFRAMGAGALDVVATPVISGRAGGDGALLAKIRTIGKLNGALVAPVTPSPRPLAPRVLPATAGVSTLVAIGASTGGPHALAQIFARWKPPAHCCTVIVQHIDEGFADSFAHWLAEQIRHPVAAIRDGAALAPGAILLARTNDHLTLSAEHRLRYSVEPSGYPYRPSVDVFLRAVALHWRKPAIGVLLTGMGRDGAHGLLAMRMAGKTTIAQDRASSAVFGMPRAAAELGAAQEIAAPEAIARLLAERV